MSDTSGPRKKSWHESKKLRKRAAFLLENPDLIPSDVCFRVRTKNGKLKEIHGHKMLFALASPVFHAEFYGDLKEEKNVEITDVSVEAFLCLQKYIYTDSFGGVSVANMIDVLAASKKYLMAKLTRYCYGFIQNHITAENSVSLWSQAQEAFDDTVTDQCVAEIGRNTTKAIATEGFLNLTQDQLFELTSWQKLTVKEFDLFEAVKRWKVLHEDNTGLAVSCSRKDGGIFQNIRFTLFTREQLADEFVIDEVFSGTDLREMYRYKMAGKQLMTFSPRPRDPAPSSLQLSIKYFVSNNLNRLGNMEWKMFGVMNILIWTDVAPEACQILRRYVENHYRFTLGHRVRVEDKAKANKGMVYCNRKRSSDPEHILTQIVRLSAEERVVGKHSGLWYAPDSVFITLNEFGPKLTIPGKMGQALSGQQPNNKPTECATDEWPGVVVGKVLSSPPKQLRELQDFMYCTKWEFDFGDDNRTGLTFLHPLAFECSIVEPES